MKNSITIDKGQKEYKDGKVVFKWEYTLSEEGDYETGTIKYHELFYDIDKTSAIIGEEESEKWIIINKRDCKDIPTFDFFKYFQKFLLDHKQKEADLLEELKKYLNLVYIKFEEGDWQSFPDSFNEPSEKKSKPLEKPKSNKFLEPILSSRPVLKLSNLIVEFKYLIIIYGLALIFYFEISAVIFGFIFFSLFGLGCLYLAFVIFSENKTFKSIIPSMGYVVVGLYCWYLSYGAIIGRF
tara:strand:+ start:102 stop:818 length:717 start_codon:yes stop_codon:yes gene_type:complete